MIMALGGVAALAYQASAGHAQGTRTEATVAGDGVTAVACVLFSLFAVYGKRATQRYSTVAINGFSYCSGAALLMPVVLWQARAFPFAHVSVAGWSSLVYMALFPSVICYLIYYHALTYIPASRVAAFIYLEPLIATLMGVAFLGERLTAPLIAGGTVIFTGVYLTERG
jgi:drug/metabolite transporter (DMT)-like permease